MRLLDIFSRHPRGDISAHADGELAPDRLTALEAHLAGCERCHTELDDLLAVRDALRDLPQVAAPRSFTLTPAMAERERAPATPRTTPSFVAMRVAGAGFAAVLAVVVMLDAGGIVDDSGGRSSDDAASLGFLNVDDQNRDAEATDSTQENEVGPLSGVSDDDMGGLATTPPLDDDNNLPAGGQAGGAPNRSEDAPDGDDVDPALAPLSDGSDQAPRIAPTTSGDLDEEIAGDDSKAAALESADGAAAASASEDDGVSYLLVIEIGLAAIAVLALGGSFVMLRRAESE